MIHEDKVTIDGIERLTFDQVLDGNDLLDANARASARLRARQRQNRGG